MSIQDSGLSTSFKISLIGIFKNLKFYYLIIFIKFRRSCSDGYLNTDQGSQFTAHEFCDWVIDQGIELSMDGKGRGIDNIFIERLWRSVKYEHVYLFPATDGKQCYQGLKKYFKYYNTERRHQSLNNEHPVAVYQQSLEIAA